MSRQKVKTTAALSGRRLLSGEAIRCSSQRGLGSAGRNAPFCQDTLTKGGISSLCLLKGFPPLMLPIALPGDVDLIEYTLKA